MIFLMFTARLPNSFNKASLIAFSTLFWVTYYEIRCINFNTVTSPIFTGNTLFGIA